MSLLFLDTSALIKDYLTEIGSAWLHSNIASNQVAISELALYECATLPRRRYLEGSLTKRQATFTYSKIRLETRNYTIIELRTNRQLQKVVSLTFNLPPTLRIRALDAIQVGAALVARNTISNPTPSSLFVFVSADAQLLRVAQHLGLATDNQENHP